MGQPNPWGGTFTNGEGPSVFKSNTDDTGSCCRTSPRTTAVEGYMLFESPDIASGDWTAVPEAKLPESPRHGTVLPVTASEYQRLLETYQPDALAEGVTVTPESATLAPGGTADFEASVTPVTAEDRSVTWSSSDESVATVDADGVVTAVDDGTATITARSVRDTEGSATVTVTTPAVPELPADAWIDDFDGSALDGRWGIESEVPDAWSLAENPGSLTLHSQSGDTYQGGNTAKNVFLVDVPAGDFTAYTSVTGAVSRDFQGAGLFVMQDFDNYVRAGLTNVSFAPGGPTVIENGVEENAVYRSSFASRPGSTHEYLRVQRTGDVIVTSYWNGVDWAEAARATVGFDASRIGLYALAAGAAPSHEVTFDYFALVAPEGADVVPEGTFTFEGSGDARYLAVGDGGALRLDDTRPLEQLALVAEEVAGEGAEGVRPVTIRESESGRPLVLDGERLALGAEGAEPTTFRLTDVGGGSIGLHADDRWVVVGDGGALVVGEEADAARLRVVPVEITEHSIEIDTDAPRTDVSDDLYGIFYEDINYAADGGLYAELVRNRSFEFNTADNGGFTASPRGRRSSAAPPGRSASATDRARWLNDRNRYSLTVQSSGAGVGVRNAGYNRGVAVEEGASYDFSVWARRRRRSSSPSRSRTPPAPSSSRSARSTSTGDDTGRKYEVRAHRERDDGRRPARRARRRRGFAAARHGVAVPRRHLGRPGQRDERAAQGPRREGRGARPVVPALPRRLRDQRRHVRHVPRVRRRRPSAHLPVEGDHRAGRGAAHQRNFWGYNQSYGIGYLEYLKFAEDIGAMPLPVVSVGANGCGSTIPEMTDPARIERWVQDTLDLIEFANGDVTTEWGAKRAELGHPEPFDLRYIGLGNEENTDTF